ncbi:MAG: alpha/beta hydrolase fold domain-containing protein [Clostridium fessum]
MAPEHPYPAALEDAVYAYRWLLEEKKYQPSQIVVAGDSAGGSTGAGALSVTKITGARAPPPGHYHDVAVDRCKSERASYEHDRSTVW